MQKFQPVIHNLYCEIDKIFLNLTDEQNTSRKRKIPKIFVHEISVKNYLKVSEFIQIGPIILVENAC